MLSLHENPAFSLPGARSSFVGGTGAVRANKYTHAHRSWRQQVSVNRAEWKKRDGLLNMWEYEVTGHIHVTGRAITLTERKQF